ncbi:hypothetical protein F5Y19DRAFT_163853 [Xylariaceae sp. FL1651]|nr:hypothetical protein F5Y19DRAFT_163853 [Xylariaceae sp. FL1651]
MYGIWPFNKGDNPPAAEFSAESKRYGRGTACNECRASRVRCSGKLDSTDCDRCKRLNKPCLYTNAWRSRRTSQEPASAKKRRNTVSTQSSSPVQPSPASDSPTASERPESPQLDPTAWVEMQAFIDQGFVDQNLVDDCLGGDGDVWASSMLNEPPPSKITDVGPVEVSDVAQPSFNTLQPITRGISGVLAPDLATPAEDDTITSKNYEPMSANTFPLFGSPLGSNQCGCLEATTSSMADLRAWAWSLGPGSDSRSSACTVGMNSAKVEDFLNLFRKSMLNLQMVENCPQLCLLSKELTILLLLVVEKLSMLLTCLAADSSGVPHYPAPADPIPSRPACQNDQQRRGKRLARFGSVEIKDPSDLNMIMKTLLQSRTRALDEYISRWNDKIQHYGLSSLEADLKKVRGDLSDIDFLK